MESIEVGDEERTCRDCNNVFVFTAGEQRFYEERGFTPPNRCKPCRDKRKAEREAGDGPREPALSRRPISNPIVEHRRAPPSEHSNGLNGGGDGGRRKRKGRRKRRNDEYGVDW